MKLICRRVDECENWCAIIADEQESWWVVEPISMRADVQELLMSWCARIADEHESWCARMADELGSSHASELISWKADIHESWWGWELMCKNGWWSGELMCIVQEWLMIRRLALSRWAWNFWTVPRPPPPPRGWWQGTFLCHFPEISYRGEGQKDLSRGFFIPRHCFYSFFSYSLPDIVNICYWKQRRR